MITKSNRTEWWRRAAVWVSLFALLSNSFSAVGQNRKPSKADHVKTATPIRHLIVLIGENRTFDHLFATYVPRKGETVSNLESSTLTARPAQIFRLPSSSRRSPRFKPNTSSA